MSALANDSSVAGANILVALYAAHDATFAADSVLDCSFCNGAQFIVDQARQRSDGFQVKNILVECQGTFMGVDLHFNKLTIEVLCPVGRRFINMRPSRLIGGTHPVVKRSQRLNCAGHDVGSMSLALRCRVTLAVLANPMCKTGFVVR
ncbi:hypothetical protein D3C73_1008600 [compost metagenome]